MGILDSIGMVEMAGLALLAVFLFLEARKAEKMAWTLDLDGSAPGMDGCDGCR